MTELPQNVATLTGSQVLVVGCRCRFCLLAYSKGEPKEEPLVRCRFRFPLPFPFFVPNILRISDLMSILKAMKIVGFSDRFRSKS